MELVERTPQTSVRDAVLARVTRLSAQARRALEAGVILAPRMQPEMLRTCAGADRAGVGPWDLGESRCEMKRLFVDPELHSHGVGRKLAEAVIMAARAMGYSTMRLDTSIRQTEALSLYASLGFRTIEPYYPLPADMAAWLVFMELKLQ